MDEIYTDQGTVIAKDEWALVWSPKDGFKLLVAQQDKESIVEKEPLMLTAFMIRIADEEGFGEELLEWWQKRVKMNSKLMKEWPRTRPKIVQEMAAKYPPNSIITAKGEDFYVCGWTEGGDLICSTTNPSINYERALATKVYICSCCLEQVGNLKHVH